MATIELSFQEVEELLESVINNRKLVKLNSKKGDKFIILSHPSAQDILAGRYIRERALLEAIKEELPSREDIEKLIEERQLGQGDKRSISELEAKIKAQQRLLNMTRIEGRRKPIEETIACYEEELTSIKAKSEHLFVLTQEFRADEESMWYLAWAASFEISGERCWSSFEAFEAETDLALRSSIMEQFAKFNRGLPASHIRYLARHVLWRIRYTAGLKLGGPVFLRGLHDLTPDQQSLLYWSNYYQSIYEMLPDDQPDEDTINDDEELDAYMEAYFKQREQERNQGRLKRRSGGKGKLSAETSDEVIVTTNHPEYLSMAYSEDRVKSGADNPDVQIVSPNSRRARNMRAAKRSSRKSGVSFGGG
jgi:hypothetical protein